MSQLLLEDEDIDYQLNPSLKEKGGDLLTCEKCENYYLKKIGCYCTIDKGDFQDMESPEDMVSGAKNYKKVVFCLLVIHKIAKSKKVNSFFFYYYFFRFLFSKIFIFIFIFIYIFLFLFYFYIFFFKILIFYFS